MVAMKQNKRAEGGVYACTWRRTPRRWTLICSKPVTARVQAAGLDGAKEKLISELLSLTGDGEPHLEFDPPLPPESETEGYFTPEYFQVEYNDSVTWHHANLEALYSGRICPQCRIAQGRRTLVPRVITSVPRFDVCGFYQDRNLGMVFSEDCLRHLRIHLRGRASLVRVEVDNRIRSKLKKRYFELSFEPELNVAIPRRHAALSGWQCKKCGVVSVQWTSSRSGAAIDGVERNRVASPVLLFRRGPAHAVAIERRIRDRILKDGAIRGFSSDRIAMLNSAEIMSSREIQNLQLRQIKA